jgi:hypothetical protein
VRGPVGRLTQLGTTHDPRIVSAFRMTGASMPCQWPVLAVIQLPMPSGTSPIGHDRGQVRTSGARWTLERRRRPVHSAGSASVSAVHAARSFSAQGRGPCGSQTWARLWRNRPIACRTDSAACGSRVRPCGLCLSGAPREADHPRREGELGGRVRQQ